MKKIVVIGNGFDLALGRDTNVESFINFCKNNELDMSKDQHKKMLGFIKKFEKYGSFTSWNNLETDILSYFEEISTKGKDGGTSFKSLKEGYQGLCFAMQKYYFWEVEKQLPNKKYEKQKSMISRFLQDVDKEDVIVSLNYTNFTNYAGKQFSSYEKIYFIHFITPGIYFLKSLREDMYSKAREGEIYNFMSFGDAENISGLTQLNADFDSYRKETIKKLEFTNSSKKVHLGKKQFSPKIEKNMQLLILGNEAAKENLGFLSKNKNPSLFLKNYPNQILKNIMSEFYADEEIEIQIIGYSFGQGDGTFNNFILDLITRKHAKLKLLLFKEDIFNESLKDDILQNIKRFVHSNNLNLDLDKNKIFKII